MSDKLDSARLAQLSCDSYNEDWDKSLVSELTCPSLAPENLSQELSYITSTPCNSVIFPVAEDTNPGRSSTGMTKCPSGKGRRTLSELLKLHAEKGTDCRLSPEEATRLGDVLGQWINAASSPYEGEDDFFTSHDDIALLPKRVSNPGGRLRGQSESAGSRS